MEPSLSRRSFLLGAATVVGAAACSKGPGVIKVGGADAARQLNLRQVSGPDYYAGADLRLAFGLEGANGLLDPAPGSVTLQVSPDQKHWGPPVTADVHPDAAPAPTYLTTIHRFPSPATYWFRASYQGRTADTPITVVDQSAIQSPFPGRPMVSVPTPTFDNHRGVESICTRNPPCPWHTVSLDAALKQPLPIALLFSTPALCEFHICGPTLDILLDAAGPYPGRIQFIHSEIFIQNSRASANTLAVRQYGLQSEPVLFGAKAGVVTDRIDGLCGRAEASAALARLAAT